MSVSIMEEFFILKAEILMRDLPQQLGRKNEGFTLLFQSQCLLVSLC